MDAVKDAEAKMDKALDALRVEFAGLRTNRAHPSLLENLRAECYGQSMPINQLATVTVVDARTLSVGVWDGNNVKAVDSAVRSNSLGLNPRIEGTTLFVMLPELTEERRLELVKVIKKKTEDAKVAIRNIRRDANDAIKKTEKDKTISEDESKRLHDLVQKATDSRILTADQTSEKKIREVSEI